MPELKVCDQACTASGEKWLNAALLTYNYSLIQRRYTHAAGHIVDDLPSSVGVKARAVTYPY